MKYVEWIEPWKCNSEYLPVICRMRLKHVVKVQIDKQPLYGSFHEKAIEDFITVNWGKLVEYDY